MVATQFKHDCPHCATRNAGFRFVYTWPTNGPANLQHILALCGVCGRGMMVLSYDTGGRSHANLVSDFVVYPGDRFRILEQWPQSSLQVPNDVPENVAGFYVQGLENLRADRWDAAGAMFRKSLDVATKLIDPSLKDQTLFKRIDSLHDQGRITDAVRDWSHEIRLDGNDAVHDENPETRGDAEATQQFAEAFLTYMFTLPAMVASNRARRSAT